MTLADVECSFASPSNVMLVKSLSLSDPGDTALGIHPVNCYSALALFCAW